MTPPTTPQPNPSIAKAAEGAAKAIWDKPILIATIGLTEETAAEIILDHLAPVQKELGEAREIIQFYRDQVAYTDSANSWLARNGGEG